MQIMIFNMQIAISFALYWLPAQKAVFFPLFLNTQGSGGQWREEVQFCVILCTLFSGGAQR